MAKKTESNWEDDCVSRSYENRSDDTWVGNMTSGRKYSQALSNVSAVHSYVPESDEESITFSDEELLQLKPKFSMGKPDLNELKKMANKMLKEFERESREDMFNIEDKSPSFELNMFSSKEMRFELEDTKSNFLEKKEESWSGANKNESNDHHALSRDMMHGTHRDDDGTYGEEKNLMLHSSDEQYTIPLRRKHTPTPLKKKHKHWQNGEKYDKVKVKHTLVQSSSRKVKTYECYTCRRIFGNLAELRLHLKRYKHAKPLTMIKGRQKITTTKINKKKEFSCMVCGEKFLQRYCLIGHLNKMNHHFLNYLEGEENKLANQHFSNSSGKRYQCQECGESFNEKLMLKSHLAIHMGSLHDCKKCQRIFDTVSALKNHMVKTHSRNSNEKSTKTSLINIGLAKGSSTYIPSPKPFKDTACGSRYHDSGTEDTEHQYKCKDCGKTFMYSLDLKYHLAIHNGSDLEEFECKICKRVLYSIGSLKYHLMTHEEDRYDCKFCSETFSHIHDLMDHLEACHLSSSAIYPYECKVCGSLFSYTNTLKDHLTESHPFHSSETPYRCRVCQQSFRHRVDLKQHVNSSHLVEDLEKPFQCRLCRQMFDRSSDLKHHMSTHADEQLHEFEFCGKLFHYSHSLLNNIEEELPFTCNLCEESFLESSDLDLHLEIIHSDEDEMKLPI